MGAVGKDIKNTINNKIPTINDNSEEIPKTIQKSQQLADYFNQRTLGKLDITPYLEPKYDKKGYTTIDYARMPKLVQQRYNQVVQEGRIESTDYGAWGKWIKLKK